MASGVVPGFRPSVNGFRFANAFPPGPTVRLGRLDTRRLGFGDAAGGLCGGMALTARDLFEGGLLPPQDQAPPANGSAAFQAIVRRQVESLDWLRVPLRYFELQALRPDPPTRWSRLFRRDPARIPSVLKEWPRIRADIDAGHPPIVGLVRASGASPWRLTRNHQVLAWAYEQTPGSIRIRVYDPNHPGNDAVELRVDVDPDRSRPRWDRIRLAQTTGEPLIGFFRQPYPPPSSLRAWR